MLAVPIALAQACVGAGAWLAPPVLEGFALLAKHDTNGLGDEARRAEAWRGGRSGIRLCGDSAGASLSDDGGDSLAIADPLGSAIDRLNQYFALRPLGDQGHTDLRHALLSARGMAAVRRLFEVSLDQRVRIARREVVPEVHGQATLVDGDLEFRMLPNPLVGVLHRLREAHRDRAALTRLVETEADAMALLDERGAFRRFLLHTLPAWEAADLPALDKRQAMLDFHLDTMAEEAATVIARGTLKDNLKLMVDNDWSGRYVGIWHTHPPAITQESVVGEPEHLRGPSEADIEVALKSGQNLTIAFDEDGFDAWDLSRMTTAADAASPHRLVRYRSASWRQHFRELRLRLGSQALR